MLAAEEAADAAPSQTKTMWVRPGPRVIASCSAPARNSSAPARNWLIGIDRSNKELGFGSVQSRQSVRARCGTPMVLRNYRWRRPSREIRRSARQLLHDEPARRPQSWAICVDEAPLRTPHMPK